MTCGGVAEYIHHRDQLRRFYLDAARLVLGRALEKNGAAGEEVAVRATLLVQCPRAAEIRDLREDFSSLHTSPCPTVHLLQWVADLIHWVTAPPYRRGSGQTCPFLKSILRPH